MDQYLLLALPLLLALLVAVLRVQERVRLRGDDAQG
jgi:hypothetical protein